MKIFKTFFFVALLAAFTACSSDDDNSSDSGCTQADWVGTYTGTINCDGSVEDVTLKIAASDTDKLLISFETPGGTSDEYNALVFNSCKISFSARNEDLGLTASINSSLDGSLLSLTEIYDYGDGDVETCKINATKK